MEVDKVFQRIKANNAQGELVVEFIRNELPALRKAAADKYQQKLVSAIQEKNLMLKKAYKLLNEQVTELEVMSGILQYPLPCDSHIVSVVPGEQVHKESSPGKVDNALENVSPIPKSEDTQKTIKEDSAQPKKEASAKKEKTPKPPKAGKQPAEDNKEVNVSRLDLRVGRILNVKKHPDAESLYVEEIDVGEEKPRTVVSGLVNFVPLEEMQNRLVVVLCNLKPAKMRGVTSEAMVMCASTPDKVEILSPPHNSVPGDRVICEECAGEPDSLLNPKKKIFEQVAPDLKTDGSCNATYKSATLIVAGKGVIKSASLINVQIK